VRRALIVLALAGCNGVLGLKEGHLRTADAGPQPDAGPRPDAPFGTPDAQSVPDSPPGTPDAGRADAAFACNIAFQNCGAGKSCDLLDTTSCSTTCRLAGAANTDEICSKATDCNVGLICLGDGTTGLCHGLCDLSTNTGCPTGSTCTFQACSSGSQGICTKDCNPFARTGCGAGQACVATYEYDPPTSMTFFVTDCELQAGTIPTDGDCIPNPFGCVTGDACDWPNDQVQTATCVQLCAASSDCTTSHPNCVAFSPPATFQGMTYNHCQ
jgi:hypothetical protein